MQRILTRLDGNPWGVFRSVIESDVPPNEKLTLLALCSFVRISSPWAETRLVAQREVAELSGFTLATTNRHINHLIKTGYLGRHYQNGWGAIYDITRPEHVQ